MNIQLDKDSCPEEKKHYVKNSIGQILVLTLIYFTEQINLPYIPPFSDKCNCPQYLHSPHHPHMDSPLHIHQYQYRISRKTNKIEDRSTYYI